MPSAVLAPDGLLWLSTNQGLAWLDTLKASLTGSTTFVTDMTKAPFHMIDLDAPTDGNGIPQPTRRSFQGGK